MRTGVLISIFILTLSGYGLYRFFSQPQQPFHAHLMSLNTQEVTSLLIEKPGKAETSIFRESNGWIASNGQINLKASPTMIQALLQNLSQITIQEVVATERKFWKVYGVDAAQGVHVRVYQGTELLEDFIIGKSDTDPTTQSPISYLRLTKGEEVYAVPGNLALDFNRDFTAFRNRLVLQMNPNVEIAALELHTLDTILQWVHTAEGWKNHAAVLDSMKMERYLQPLQYVASDAFADDFDEVQGSKYLYQILIITKKDNTEPFVITCYRDTTRKPTFIIQSSQNKETFFASDSLGIYHTIFGKVNDFNKNVKRDTTSLR